MTDISWKKNGYTVISNLIDNNLITRCINYLKNLQNSGVLKIKDFGSQGMLEFPCGNIIDDLSFNENIIKTVCKFLNTDHILLCQSDTWGKTGGNMSDDISQSNNDQRMHMDYGNNTFLHPDIWDSPEAVAIIIYLSDTTETGGQTALVPKNKITEDLYSYPYVNMPGQGNFKFINDAQTSENYFKENYPQVYNFRQKLYNKEIKVNAKVGDVLFYRLDLWHRGTPVNEGKTRFVTNLLYKKRDCYWINTWNSSFSKKMYYNFLERFIEDLSPLQRSVLGIPLPGDDYWTLEKIYLLKCRYINMDISEYMHKLNSFRSKL